ncbi:scarecrow-like protein 6 [Humulus lupulus]|uniref:scarecrow-like protein 6 n=1 Tax=Humulus lupulus TaxID=3486 RepID=UPI002B40F3BD|nr:scarecrow-like protein 6 [Humulus lupulus]
MKTAMPLPFEEFQGKGVLDFSSTASDSLSAPQKWNSVITKENCYVGSEPTSVLDTRRSPSPPTSTSTLSSSLGSGGGVGATGSADTTTGSGLALASEDPSGTATLVEEKCGIRMEDWDSVLSESPGEEESIMKLFMADVDGQSLGLNKLLQSGSASQEMEFNAGGFGVVDQGFGFEPIIETGSNCSDFHFNTSSVHNYNANYLLPVSFPSLAFQQQQQQLVQSVEAKPQAFSVINQNQAQMAPNVVMPFYSQLQEHHLVSPPPAKRLNTGATIGSNYMAQKFQFPNSGQEQLQLFHQQRPTTLEVSKQKAMSPAMGEELANHQLQQALTDQLSKAAELIESGNSILAQEILARLNHHVSPFGKPFQRAVYYFKEALEVSLHMNATNSLALSPFNLILKIGAYKTFSEISPLLQFANFTCNQAILEAVEGHNRIHVIDFDIGYGGQWASFMQELAIRNGGGGGSGGGGGGGVSLKITAFVSPSTHDELELSFTHENLKHFASEINLPFELEIFSLEMFNSGGWPLPLRASDTEAIAVNIPISSFFSYPLSLPLVLRFVKQLSPKVVVSLERGWNRTALPFSLQIIHSLKSYAGLFESLDAVNINSDALQKIERCLLQPEIEKNILGCRRSPEKTPPWRSSFLSSGFSPLTFSNFTESQAECLVQRSQVRGFHVEKKQTSLVLCWQQKELVSISAWSC